jgi:hypothetical protein
MSETVTDLDALDAVHDIVNMPLQQEPEWARDDLDAVRR